MQIHSDYILFVAVSLPIGFFLGYLFGRLRYRPEIDLLKEMIEKLSWN